MADIVTPEAEPATSPDQSPTPQPAAKATSAPDAPVEAEPVPDEPVPDEPVPDEPALDESAFDEPAFDEPAFDEPAFDEPAHVAESPGLAETEPMGEPAADGAAPVVEAAMEADMSAVPPAKLDPKDSLAQCRAVAGVMQRLLGTNAVMHFKIEIIPQENERDVFEVESVGGRIVLRGSCGVAACRALKWYLNEMCQVSLSWRGDSLSLPNPLPHPEQIVRQTTPHTYRYMFHPTTYGYALAWWRWPEWERMLDLMALNGINLPLMPLGQEAAWQKTYETFGLNKEDLKDFFSGPAFLPWHRLGTVDGWGGPMPQAIIDEQGALQKNIVRRARELGMKPILAGFAGHVPRALKAKYPDLSVFEPQWVQFPRTLWLDWRDPMFAKIAAEFMRTQAEMYGTDHFYAIDPLYEMEPPLSSTDYIETMARTMFSSMDAVDPEGIWVMMTWFCKSPQLPDQFWTQARTKTFLDAVPNHRMLCLELRGEDTQATGWFRQNGWHGKPWIWCVTQNFGDRVDLYGGLPQIVQNYEDMQNAPDKGCPVGLGIASEGLCYNPVVFELLFDMMWGEGVKDLDKWQRYYVVKRYGRDHPAMWEAWFFLFASRYRYYGHVDTSALCYPPALTEDFEPDMNIIHAWKLMLDAADDLKDCSAYRFDLVNIGREAMASFAARFIHDLKNAYEDKDIEAFTIHVAEMLQYIRDCDALMGTSEHFLFGRWIEAARSWGGSDEEKQRLEWGAKTLVTRWNLHAEFAGANNQAIREWSGFIADYCLPRWRMYCAGLENAMRNNRPFNPQEYRGMAEAFEREWLQRHNVLPVVPQGDPVGVSRHVWARIGKGMWERGGGPGMNMNSAAADMEKKRLLRRGARFIQKLQNGRRVLIVVMGTSLSGGRWRWVNVLKDWLDVEFPGMATIFNEAIGASASGKGPGNLFGHSGLDVLPRVIAHRPDAVFIEFAINDAYIPYGISLSDARSNLETMIERILQAKSNTEIILQTMNCVLDMNAPGRDYASDRPELAEYSAMYREVAQNRSLLIIDHFPHWHRLLKHDLDRFIDLVPDGMHPHDDAYRDVVFPELQRALIEGRSTDPDQDY